jgi:hypothetical protein
MSLVFLVENLLPKEFTRAERGGRIKHTYSKRQVVWDDKIAELVRVG